LLEDEEEPHLNTDQVGCERNGSRVESPSANMPIVTGPKNSQHLLRNEDS
jgi:hypothetical protein